MKNRDELQYPSDYRYEPVARWRYVYVPAVGFLMAVGTNQLISLLNIDRFFPGYEETSQTLYAMNIWAELAVLGILVPIVEELIFRAVVYERIRRYCSVTASAAVGQLFLRRISWQYVPGHLRLSVKPSDGVREREVPHHDCTHLISHECQYLFGAGYGDRLGWTG